MPAIFPGEYIISHGAWPLPAPAKPGQAISITLGNPSDIQYDAVSRLSQDIDGIKS